MQPLLACQNTAAHLLLLRWTLSIVDPPPQLLSSHPNLLASSAVIPRSSPALYPRLSSTRAPPPSSAPAAKLTVWLHQVRLDSLIIPGHSTLTADDRRRRNRPVHAFPPLWPDPGTQLLVFKTSQGLFCKKYLFPFILFLVNFENSLEIIEKSEKCEINFVWFLEINSIWWCDEFALKLCITSFKNRISL